MAITIFVSLRETLFREAIIASLKSNSEFKVVGQSLSEKDSIPQILAIKPKILLVDLNFSTLNILKSIKKKKCSVRSILISTIKEENLIEKAFAYGACGLILTNRNIKELLDAIRQVHINGFYSNQLAESIIGKGPSTETQKNYSLTKVNGQFSEREIAIMNLLAEEKTSSEIASEIFLSTRRVEEIRTELRKKANVSNTAGLIDYAHKNGLLKNVPSSNV